jgi:hypothetical protein
MAAEIFIGGRVSEAFIPELCRRIVAEGVSLWAGDACFQPNSATDLLEGRSDHAGALVLRLCDDQANWGHFEALEDFLVEHAIPFDRFSEGKYEYDPEWVSFRPGTAPRVLPINSQREPQVYLSLLRDLCRQVALTTSAAEQGQQDAVIAHLRELQASVDRLAPPLPPPLESLVIEETCPAPTAEPCECEQPGYFTSGVPGILAHVENGFVAPGGAVERCDQCERFSSDDEARRRLGDLGMLGPEPNPSSD